MACESPTRKSKKLQQKRVAGRKIAVSTDVVVALGSCQDNSLPGQIAAGKRGRMKFVCRSGASIRHRICARGRGFSQSGVVLSAGRLGDCLTGVHVRVVTHVYAEGQKQAPLPSESNNKRGECALEERECGAALKMAAPITVQEQEVIELSDDEGVDSLGEGGVISGVDVVNAPEWDVSNQTIYQSGQHMEVTDEGGMSMRGMFYGEADVRGMAGRAQVRVDFWQPGSLVQGPGCGGFYALDGHKEQVAPTSSGWPAGNQASSLGVSTPSGHRKEERVRPEADHLTSGESILPVTQSMQPFVQEEPSTSWGTGSLDSSVTTEDDLLDYDEGNGFEMAALLQHNVLGGGCVPESNKGRSFGVLQASTRAAVRGDRHGGWSRIDLSAGNLPQGEERGECTF
ncbi:hypothetical protein NDU88_006497 [Pleurodeles waltl]|uniref:Uncharacterized protein n=1 Tax=Pleurodeles waltl TaxID=8319 RepID=A0AAV7TYP7_PLEWA|nr:hypothetical protein NDU88_006497 [Pleurodeles waltl]